MTRLEFRSFKTSLESLGVIFCEDRAPSEHGLSGIIAAFKCIKATCIVLDPTTGNQGFRIFNDLGKITKTANNGSFVQWGATISGMPLIAIERNENIEVGVFVNFNGPKDLNSVWSRFEFQTYKTDPVSWILFFIRFGGRFVGY